MPDGLARVIAVVHDQAEVVGMPGILRDRPRGLQQLSAKSLVLEVRQPRDVGARDDENVEGRPWIGVGERENVRVLVDDRRWDLLRGDLAEDAVGHVRTLLIGLRPAARERRSRRRRYPA
jgi:hypothetical protein